MTAAVRVCEEFFQRSQSYQAAREQEFRELIQMLRDALATLAGNSQKFHGQLVRTSERLSNLEDLNDIRTLKSRLTEEVVELKRAVREKQRQEQAHHSELAERVGTLEHKLERTKKEAALDALTGVPNRRSFDETIREWVHAYKGVKRGFVLGMIDLDDFKKINDEHGHVVGDRVLKCAAAALVEGIREGDFVARYGGEEFAILLASTALREEQERLEELVQSIGGARYKYTHLGEELWVRFTVSAGLTEYTPGDGPEELIRRADDALYLAKKRGKNGVATKKKRLFGILS